MTDLVERCESTIAYLAEWEDCLPPGQNGGLTLLRECKVEIDRLREELEAERLWIKEGRKLHIEPEVTDYKRFEMMADHIRTIAEEMLTEFFGEQCDVFDPSCPCCQRWNSLDDLIVNPFGEE